MKTDLIFLSGFKRNMHVSSHVWPRALYVLYMWVLVLLQGLLDDITSHFQDCKRKKTPQIFLVALAKAVLLLSLGCKKDQFYVKQQDVCFLTLHSTLSRAGPLINTSASTVSSPGFLGLDFWNSSLLPAAPVVFTTLSKDGKCNKRIERCPERLQQEKSMFSGQSTVLY